MAKSHHDLDIYPMPKDQAPLFVNEPWIVDGSLLEGVTGEVNMPDDNIRVYVPLDISKDVILLRLKIIIAKYGEANEANELDFLAEVRQLVYQIELYDQIWTARNSVDGMDKVVELVEAFVALLEEIPDGCAEYFPFALIEELKQDYLGNDCEDDIFGKVDLEIAKGKVLKDKAKEVMEKATKPIHEWNGMTSRDVAEDVVEHLKSLPLGAEISTYEVLEALYGKVDFEFEELFDIDLQVHILAEMEGLYLDESAYDGMVTGLPFHIPFVIKDIAEKRVGMESIDITEWLKQTYGNDLNPKIGTVCFCQSDDEVWITIEYHEATEFGVKSWSQYINLDFIAEPYDEPLDIVSDGVNPFEKYTFDPFDAIEDNVAKFVNDRITLENITPLFDK